MLLFLLFTLPYPILDLAFADISRAGVR